MNTTLTERTSKPLKLQLLLSLVAILFGGLGFFIYENSEGSFARWTIYLVAIGAIWYIVTKLRIWWNHA